MTDKAADDITGSAMDASAPGFDAVLATRLTRRDVVQGLGAAAFLLGAPQAFGESEGVAAAPTRAPDSAPRAEETPATPGFAPVPRSLADTVRLPPGYRAQVLCALGDPLDAATPAWGGDGREAANSFSQRVGDHHDGMAFFGMNALGRWRPAASDRGLLCLNHEHITAPFLHADAAALESPRPLEAALKEMLAHGISVLELARTSAGTLARVRQSPRQRRITPLTPVTLHGPAAGSAWLRTRHSPDGRRARGTLNNCSSGATPWGSYLTCEENWNHYFRRAAGDDARRPPAEVELLRRYGIEAGQAGWHDWASVASAADDTRFRRWDASVPSPDSRASPSTDFRNEPNTFGYVVEIDPFDPAAAPRKRTALGRFAHENARVAPVRPGQPVVIYMGDDSRFEYLYKFVSAAPWDPADAGRGLAAGDKYLDAGTLYAARFEADGRGAWLALAPGRSGLGARPGRFGFATPAEVAVGTRLAADAAGATRMDRPEWVAINPRNGEVYCSLTNNSARGEPGQPGTDAANPRHYRDAGARGTTTGNVNGHIIRWREDDGRHDATSFHWDVYLFGAEADADPATVNLSGLDAGNEFSSPDGLWFDPRGLLWIQTDDHAARDRSNCMMLAAAPGTVGDGATVRIGAQATRVGQAPGARLRRFLVGPRQCEITGVAMTPDGKAMFVNIQHPGEDTAATDLATPASYGSHWPHSLADATAIGSGSQRPRSATILITRDDGGLIGD